MVKPLEPTLVKQSLERVLDSSGFSASPTLQKFLRYVVEESLAGREAEIKAYTIAVDALDKPDNFDAQLDPTVRVLAGRVRTALDLFYADEGKNDSVRIEVPIGSYRPKFTALAPIQNENAAVERTETIQAPLLQPTVQGDTNAKPARSAAFSSLIALVLIAVIGVVSWPFLSERFGLQTASGVAQNRIQVLVDEVATVAQGGTAMPLANDLATALARNQAIVVTRPSGGVQTGNSQNSKMDFIIRTSTLGSGDERRVSVSFTNAHTSALIWARNYQVATPKSDQNGYDQTVVDITRELSTQLFGASIKALEGRDPKSLTASQLFVLATWTPGPALNSLKWEKERVELARLALSKEPDFGPAYSVLADKLSYLAQVDGPSNTPEAAAEARSSALRAAELSPGDVNVMFNVAQHYWHSGDVPEAIRKMKRTLEIDPTHGFASFFLNVLPYTCSAAPDDVLGKAQAFDRSLSQDNPIRWATLTWLGWLHLNRNELSEALDAEQRAAQIFQIPYTSMRRATVLNALGRTQEAVDIIKGQRGNWPNINPLHFAEVTMPRLCSKMPGGEAMIRYYQSLADDTAVLLR